MPRANPSCTKWTFLLLWCVLMAGLNAAETLNEGGLTPFSPPSEKNLNAVKVLPHYRRVEVPTGGLVRIQVRVQMVEAGMLMGVDIECPCVTTEMNLPRSLPAGESVVTLIVKGVLPGLKQITLRTSHGPVTLVIDVATPGFGDANQVARAAVQATAAANLTLIAIVHDLSGALRNCGCSSGSLGGIEHLAALSQVLPGARLALTGDIDGATPGVSSALAVHGWEVRPADIVVAADPLPVLTQPGLLAVVAPGFTAFAHQRIVTPFVDRGAIAHLLFVDDGRRVVEQRLLPIDRSFPSVPGVIERFPSTGQVLLDRSVNPSTSCKACHSTAHASWLVSAHARALNSLSTNDQTSACATCHTTSLPGRAERAPHVGCTMCHEGAEAHAITPTVKTTGTTSCRECHDANHHPAFDKVSAWLRIQHKMER